MFVSTAFKRAFSSPHLLRTKSVPSPYQVRLGNGLKKREIRERMRMKKWEQGIETAKHFKCFHQIKIFLP